MAAAQIAQDSGKKPSFAMGILGALIGASIGSLVYYLIYKTTGVRLFLAIGVGGLTGWLANLMGKGEGSKELGGLAAVFTVCAVLAAQYFVALDWWHKTTGLNSEVTQAIQDGGYSASVKQAKEAIGAIPNGTDAEIRTYLAKQQTEDGRLQSPRRSATTK